MPVSSREIDLALEEFLKEHQKTDETQKKRKTKKEIETKKKEKQQKTREDIFQETKQVKKPEVTYRDPQEGNPRVQYARQQIVLPKIPLQQNQMVFVVAQMFELFFALIEMILSLPWRWIILGLVVLFVILNFGAIIGLIGNLFIIGIIIAILFSL